MNDSCKSCGIIVEIENTKGFRKENQYRESYSSDYYNYAHYFWVCPLCKSENEHNTEFDEVRENGKQ